jgi:GNAT superfamily N-acetyltransferase
VASTDNGELVGGFTLDQNQDAEYASVPWSIVDDRVAVVHRLFVDPSHHGRGIAKKMMSVAERLATDLGCGSMRLDAFTLNPEALRLYQSLGYRDAGAVTFRKGVFRCFEKRLDATLSSSSAPKS